MIPVTGLMRPRWLAQRGRAHRQPQIVIPGSLSRWLTNRTPYARSTPAVIHLRYAQEELESELMERPSCLLVSHDQRFVRDTGNRFWQIQGRKLIEFDIPEPFPQRL